MVAPDEEEDRDKEAAARPGIQKPSVTFKPPPSAGEESAASLSDLA